MNIFQKIVAVLVICSSWTVNVRAQAEEFFKDVAPGSKYYAATSYLAIQGIVDGYGDELFYPGKGINRAEFLKMLVKAKIGEVYGDRDLPFNDVRAGEWYAKYIGYAYEVGWIQGYDDGSFRPGSSINRAEAVSLMGKVAGWEVNKVSGDVEVFSDVRPEDWFEDYVIYGLNRGLIGEEHGYFRPEAEVTRGEAAALVYGNFFTLYGNVALTSHEGGNLRDRNVLLNVPFTAQAPLGEWDDPRQADGCEEASVLMAVSWARNESWSLEEAKNEIIAIAEYEKANFPTFIDTSIEDTMNWIVKGYFEFENVEMVENVTADSIKEALYEGKVVVVAVDGRVLANQFYTPPGPLQHMLVIKGYDAQSNEFITNDPGTRQGQAYRYSEEVMEEALYDYVSGEEDSLPENVEKRMLIFWK